jgi:hypothetical protein
MEPNIIEEIRDYCERAGISPSTLGVRVLGNSRFYDRIQKRFEKTEQDVEKLRAYMRENPPAEHGIAAPHSGAAA